MTVRTISDFENENKNTEDNEDEVKDIKQLRLEFRRYVRRLCSLMGLALCLMFLLIQLVGFGLAVLNDYLSQGLMGGAGRAISDIINSQWFSTAGISILGYGVALPPMLLLLSRVPEVIPEPKKMRFRKFVLFLVLAMGMGYVCSLAGSLINLVIAYLTGRMADNMNPVTEVLGNLDFATVLYLSVLGPVIEEFIFRKVLLNRVRPLGEKAAIVFTAVLFGLLHGNLAQFFYATFIGIILGYMAVKTGHIFYSCLLHIIINSHSVILSLILLSPLSDNIVLYGLFSLAVMALFLVLVVAAIVVLVINVPKTRLRRGDVPAGIEYRDYSASMFLNLGVILFIGICMLMIVFYALLA